MISLFIGVVSYERSRFSASQGPDGLAHSLSVPLRDRGVETTVAVNTGDLLDLGLHPIDHRSVQAGLSAELSLDRRWAAFLRRTGQPRWWWTHLLQTGRRTARRLRPPSTRAIIRLLNIELSHLDLMRRAVRNKADWLLILEDDAATSDVQDCADGIAGLMGLEHPPAYVNISASFPLSTLGVQHLLREIPDAPWVGHEPRRLLASARPITNTVCAVLYRGDFLHSLIEALDSIPLEPVLPIDWKLNQALMNLWDDGVLGPGDCWTVEPAPIRQLSMRPVE